jgi:hypothetical protein
VTSTPGSGWLPNWSSIDTGSMSLLIGWESSGHRVQVRRLPISKTVARDLLQPITATTDRLAHDRTAAYSPDLELDDDQYAVVPREQLDPASSLLAGLEDLTPAEAVQDDMKHAMLFYALAVGPATGRVVFVRRANPRANLARKYVTLFGDELSRVTSPLLSFDLDLIDLVLVAGHGLAVLNLKAYERLFRDSPELLARTPAKVAELNAVISLTPAAQAALTEAAGRNSRIRSRLLAILGRGHLNALDKTKLRAGMRRHGLDPAHHLVGGNLDFTADEALAIMQLLNEDLAIGELSDTEFIINKKSPRT